MSDYRLEELEEAITPIKWDVFGLCEVRRSGQENIANIFFISMVKHKAGMELGFLVKKYLKNKIMAAVGQGWRPHKLGFSFTLTLPTHQKNKIASSKNARYALSFKYQAGLLLEYALKKEKLLLEVRKSSDTGTLIDLIAFGLPNYVADKIDREKLRNTEDLYNDIEKLEQLDKYDIGTVRDYEADIELMIDKYCCKRPYRCSPEDRREMELQVSNLLKNNLIEESYSPFAAQ
ncbi:hypothetical protein EVAR_49112_1 [Eumeta japonica]|uniref:Uncharacterized protein n=1 Tax=Eumeta variegata TaxID=151549 RepID=A0A4C1YPK9_EUMVA|nr:hypothetical protein EVAR_49112_1 [Eumeta japonica]